MKRSENGGIEEEVKFMEFEIRIFANKVCLERGLAPVVQDCDGHPLHIPTRPFDRPLRAARSLLLRCAVPRESVPEEA